jgi:hypothetical protein
MKTPQEIFPQHDELACLLDDRAHKGIRQSIPKIRSNKDPLFSLAYCVHDLVDTAYCFDPKITSSKRGLQVSMGWVAPLLSGLSPEVSGCPWYERFCAVWRITLFSFSACSLATSDL